MVVAHACAHDMQVSAHRRNPRRVTSKSYGARDRLQVTALGDATAAVQPALPCPENQSYERDTLRTFPSGDRLAFRELSI